MTADNAWLARKLREHEQAIQALARGTRLPNSSLQNGETITLGGDGGVLEIGDGGLNYVDGPPPPRAAAPTLESGVGTVFVSWDGTFAPPEAAEGEEVDSEDTPDAPLNFARVQVHASTDPEEPAWGADTLQGEILAPSGGTVVIRGGDLEDTVYVCLITETRDGQTAPPSDLAEIVITGIDLSSITEELDAANLDLSNLDGDMFAANAELDAAKILFKNLDMDLIHTDDGTLRDALEDARRLAQEQAEEAKNNAIEAAIAADHWTYWLPESLAGKGPSQWGVLTPPPKENDTALLPNNPPYGGYVTYRYRSGKWTQQVDANAVIAVDIAAQAYTTADGKNRITRSVSQPPAQYTGRVDDLWWVLSSLGTDGSVLGQYRWNGSIWVRELIDSAVLAYVDAAKITSGVILADRIDASSIKSDLIQARMLAANSIGARAIAAEAIEAEHIAAGAITTVQLAANSVTAEKIVGLSITAEKLAALSISTEKIVAGAVVADKIAANAVTADKIAALAVTADKIAANAVTADKIAANSVTAGALQAGAIDGQVITGATIRTAEAGARVEMNSQGLKQYNAANNVIVDMSGGTLKVNGGVITADEFHTIPPSSIRSSVRIRQENTSAGSSMGDSAGRITLGDVASTTTAGRNNRGGIQFNLLEEGYGYLELSVLPSGDFFRLGADTSAWSPHPDFTSGAELTTKSPFVVNSPELVIPSGVLRLAYGKLTTEVAGDGLILKSNTGGDLEFQKDTNPYIRSYTIRDRTYSASASMHCTVNGVIGKIGSSRRYKQDIMDAEPLPGLLDVTTRTWHDRGEVERHAAATAARKEIGEGPLPAVYADADEPRWHFGAIAEEVDDLGLKDLVIYDEYGRPDSLAYDRFGVALIPYVRDHNQRIMALEQEVERLRTLIGANT